MTDHELYALSTYRNEALDLCVELENALLELEESPDDMEVVGRIFRAMHTIKGSGSMFGLDDVAFFTHEVETVYDLVRNGELSVSKELIDLTLVSRDWIMEMVNAHISGEGIDLGRTEELIGKLRRLVGRDDDPERPAGKTSPAGGSKKAEDPQRDKAAATYRIRFRPDKDIFHSGIDPSLVLADLEDLGESHIIAHTDNIPDLGAMDPEGCHIWWDIILTTTMDIKGIWDVFIFTEGNAKISVEQIDDGGYGHEDCEYKRLGQILLERGDISTQELREILGERKLLGESLVEKSIVQEDLVESALAEQAVLREVRNKRRESDMLQTLRVPAGKLDTLVNLVGELVTLKANLRQVTQGWGDFDLVSDNSDTLSMLMENNFQALSDIAYISEEVERITEDIKESTISMRMMPIGEIFGKYRRMVRDLSAELGRDVRLMTSGAETELDKTMIEKLNDPLVHLIRNCIDHGIESPEERRAQDKPVQGTVHLSAEHSGGNVLIHIQDDGRGIDPAYIKAKAVERGYVKEGQELTDKEALQLVFAPGFSTAEKATSVSGRGVGMDVVKQSVDNLRGNLDIVSSKGNGTTITLKLPLTLAIIDGLLVKVAAENFVLPLLAVEECVELSGKAALNSNGRHLIDVRGALVPYIRLRERFDINSQSPELEQVVIVSLDGNRFGFAVDSVVGEHQTVIKPLGSFYKNVKVVSGATILGDGSVALILDINNLYHETSAQEHALYG